MADNQTPASVLMFLSGSRRGVALTLSGDAIRIGTDPTMDVRLPEDTEPLPAPHHATLNRRGSTYELESEPGQRVWVNGDPVDRLVLASGDVIDIGRDGAILRFRQYPPPAPRLNGPRWRSSLIAWRALSGGRTRWPAEQVCC